MLVLAVLGAPPPALAESTTTIRMRVLDDATGRPVGGAAVRYRADIREGTLTGHGGRIRTLFDIATISDSTGLIDLSPIPFEKQGFGLFGMNTNYEAATLTIAKEGYRPLRLSNRVLMPSSLRETLSWEANGQTVRLQAVDATYELEQRRQMDLTQPWAAGSRLRPAPSGRQVLRVVPGPPGTAQQALDRAR